MAKSVMDQVVGDQDHSHDAGQKARDDARRRAEEARVRAKNQKKAAKVKAKQDKVDRKHELKMAKVEGKKKDTKQVTAGPSKKPHTEDAKPKDYPPPGKDTAFDMKATAFISNVYTKLQDHRPGYSPLGLVLEDKKWIVTLNKDGFGASGIVEAGVFKQPLIVEAEYITIRELEKGDFLMAMANTATSKKQFIAKCYVVAHIEDGLLPGLKAFRHPNVSPFFYDIDRDKLYFNANDMKTTVFAEWFKPSGTPKTVIQLIKEVVDKNGVFTKKAVGVKLNLSGEELDALFETLIKKNIIVDVDKKNYAFV